ncbi:hypothetical protein [Phenylobacterium sp.]|uniref:hypothetical protein n=1 Tax=Phenylobacterium sp. TaxID=1871053 RepID=UPI00301D8601
MGDAFIASWTEDVEALALEKAAVQAVCGCGYRKLVDLDKLIRERGPRFSLWGRHPRCPAEGCNDRLKFYAVRPGGSWKLNLWGVPLPRILPLHDRWHATLPKPERDKFPAARLMRNADGYLSISCAICAWNATIERPEDVEAWGHALSIDGFRDKLRGMCGRPVCRREVDLVLRPRPPRRQEPPASTPSAPKA